MNDLAEPSAATRRAALTLHSLERGDRAWLLGQLSDGQRALLEPLLDDLESLGIPRDRALVQDAMGAEVPPVVPKPAALDGEAWCLVLAREPQAARALWLATMQEPEWQDVLRHWPLPLEQPPAAVTAANWSAPLREAVRQTWAELAREGKQA